MLLFIMLTIPNYGLLTFTALYTFHLINSPLHWLHLILFQSEHLLLQDFVSTSRVFELREANGSNLSLKGPQQRVITSPMNLRSSGPAAGARQREEDSSFLGD